MSGVAISFGSDRWVQNWSNFDKSSYKEAASARLYALVLMVESFIKAEWSEICYIVASLAKWGWNASYGSEELFEIKAGHWESVGFCFIALLSPQRALEIGEIT